MEVVSQSEIYYNMLINKNNEVFLFILGYNSCHCCFTKKQLCLKKRNKGLCSRKS